MFSCVDLQLKFQHKLIFNQVGFSLLPGSIYVIKGANGSGKSSLLKVIANLVEPNKGSIFSSTTIGYLGHENALKEDLSVFENLLLWGKLQKTELLIYPAMAQFKLTELEDVKCKYLSAGLQRKVALARMIISNTNLWLLDEPEACLDKHSHELLLKLLQVKISNGGIALIASHNLEYYTKIPIIDLDDFKYE